MNLSRIMCSVRQKIKQYIWKHENNNIFILMFHEIVQCGKDPEGSWNYAITINSFHTLLNEIAINNRFVSVDDIVENGDYGVAVTFDDVYKSVFDNAVPFLLKNSIPFCVFITPSFLDQTGYLTSDELKVLINEPLCTIGYHTRNHIGMRKFTDEQVIRDAIEPVAFEKKFCVSCDYFAYPYGSIYMCPPKIRRVVAASQYKAAVGTIHSGTNINMVQRERYYIPRLNLCEQNWDEVLQYIRQNSGGDVK